MALGWLRVCMRRELWYGERNERHDDGDERKRTCEEDSSKIRVKCAVRKRYIIAGWLLAES